jgi:hypothetical protein
VESLSSAVPPIILGVLLSLVPAAFRFLARLKRHPTGEQVELDVQRHLFLFLFVQVFLIITISSGVTSFISETLQNPTSVPRLLASDLLKASNFFLSFVILQGLATSGGWLLQLDKLLKYLWTNRFFDLTPRDRFRLMSTIHPIEIGSTYPVVTNLAAITMAYSIVSPVIVFFATISIGLNFIAFKYRLLLCNGESG